MPALPSYVHDANVHGLRHADNKPTIKVLQDRYIAALRNSNERTAGLFGSILRDQLELKGSKQWKK